MLRHKVLKWIPAIVFSILFIVFAIFQRETLWTAILMLLVAVVIAYLLHPLDDFLMRYLPSGWSAGATCAVTIGIIAGLIYFIVPALYHQVGQIVRQVPEYAQQIQQAWENARQAAVKAGISESIFTALESRADHVAGQFAGTVQQVFMQMGGAVAKRSWLALSPVSAFYLLRDREFFFDRMLHMIPARLRPTAIRWGDDIRTEIGSFVRGQLLVALIVGVLTALGLALTGVQGYLVLGVCMGVLNLVPYFGSFLGMVPIVCLSIVQGRLIPAFLVSIAVQQVESAVISPRIMGDAANVHPLMVMVVLLIGGGIGGSGGMLLSLPIYLIMRVTAKGIYRSLLENAPEMEEGS